MDVVFKPAAELTLEQLAATFNAGYEGYVVPLNLSIDQMRNHIEANNIDLSHSRVAWLDEQIVGLCLLGVRDTTGWIGGIGMALAYRGKGIGRKLLQTVLDEAKKVGLTRVMLEVITSNEPAYKLYQSLSFETQRRLLVIGCEKAELADVAGVQIETMTLDKVQTYRSQFETSWKPWQRVNVTGNAWVARRDGEVRAYVIGQVLPKRLVFSDAGFASGDAEALKAILVHLHSENPEIGGNFVNLAENDPAWPVFEALGYAERLAQYEMAL